MQVINMFSAGDVTADELGDSLNKLNFVNKLHSFTTKHTHTHSISDMSPIYDSDDEPPKIDELITLYPSAVTTYFSPSDLSGIGGMHSECIHATHIWRKALIMTLFLSTPTLTRTVCVAWMSHELDNSSHSSVKVASILVQ